MCCLPAVTHSPSVLAARYVVGATLLILLARIVLLHQAAAAAAAVADPRPASGSCRHVADVWRQR